MTSHRNVSRWRLTLAALIVAAGVATMLWLALPARADDRPCPPPIGTIDSVIAAMERANRDLGRMDVEVVGSRSSEVAVIFFIWERSTNVIVYVFRDNCALNAFRNVPAADYLRMRGMTREDLFPPEPEGQPT